LGIYKSIRNFFGFSTQELWTLFLMAAFPTHVWTILLVFQDFSWIAERNNNWDALSIGAYGLLVAFAESVFTFAITLIASFLVSKKWDRKKRIAILSTMVILTGIWAIINQLYFLLGHSIPIGLNQFLIARAHPLRAIYAICLLIVSPTVILPIYGLIRSGKALQTTLNLIERLSLLTTLYLVADLGSLIIVLIRNL
jgi:hypothetical protein